jgi:hypothetical protein
MAHLVLGGSADPQQQATTANGADDPTRRVGAEDDTKVGGELLHGSTKGGLGVAGEKIGFVDDDDWQGAQGQLGTRGQRKG